MVNRTDELLLETVLLEKCSTNGLADNNKPQSWGGLNFGGGALGKTVEAPKSEDPKLITGYPCNYFRIELSN